MDNALESGRIESRDHRRKLPPAQVITGNHADQTRIVEDARRQLVGNVKRIVADLRELRGDLAIETDGGEVANEERIGQAVEDLFQQPVLVGLDDSKCRQRDRYSSGARKGDSILV